MWATIKGLFGLVGLIRQVLTWLIAKENQQIGRNEKAHEITQETAETENAMRDVDRPDDGAVERSLHEGRF